MEIRWDVTSPGRFDSEPLVVPARYSFPQGAIYRLKLSNVAGRPGIELYPTVEVAVVVPRTEAFLAHSAIPVQFTEEDFDQVLSGNFVTKVVYCPIPSPRSWPWPASRPWSARGWSRATTDHRSHRDAGRSWRSFAWATRTCSFPLPAAAPRATASPRPAYQAPMALSRSGVPGLPLLWRLRGLRFRRDHAAVWDADVRHAHRTAGSAARALGNPAGLQSHTIVNHTQ